ncbi:GPW/gp25 family protein [Caballeronia sp. ATUFL_M2_KS44]|uniref:GPW/gp25 family protein n=1 Tax=Caballeronia sp. ATUFL_M2_KS44 TaxID=2921767 RepID=UPI0020285293|nr:GPW/gp25 family protein [Caballeronia sp. ATUFL_M2_KS44]
MAAASIAWKFRMPGEASVEHGTGPRVSVTGGIETVAHAKAVRQAILMLLNTRPGERVMRPEYGCALHRLMFAPNDDTTAGLAMHYVRFALTRWEPRIDIVRLDAGRDHERADVLVIDLCYRLRETREVEELRVPLNLNGA